MVPSTLGQLTILLVLVLPGIVYSATRRWLRGPDPEDREFSVRVMRAMAVSIALDATYVLLLGDRLLALARRSHAATPSWQEVLEHPRKSAGAALILLVVIPWMLGLATRLERAQPDRETGIPANWWAVQFRQRIHPTPSGWDRIAPKRGQCWVRIYTDDGHWVGGYLSGEAYVSTYPEPRDIFIDIEYLVSDEGVLVGPVPGSLGLFVPLSGKERVAWLTHPPQMSDRPASEPSTGLRAPSAP